MKKGIIGKKIGMTQIFDEKGKVIPVTVIEAGPCVVTQKKTVENDGYNAVQIGFGDQKPQRVSKPLTGHFKKGDVAPKKTLRELRLEDIVFQGYGGVLCVESGGPTPGVGCAGRGIISAFEKLAELQAFEVYRPDIVIYDVLGDVVCGGFAMPIREGYAREVFIVSSGEMMALYAASNIAQAIRGFGKRGYARLCGIILNARNIEGEREIVRKAAEEISTDVIAYIPRSGDIQRAEAGGGTVFECLEDSPLRAVYEGLADRVLDLTHDEKGEQQVC